MDVNSDETSRGSFLNNKGSKCKEQEREKIMAQKRETE